MTTHRRDDGLHVSASSLRLLEDCGRAWFYRYVVGVPPEDVSSGLVLGKALHEGIAEWYRCARDGEPEPTVDRLGQIVRAAIVESSRSPIPIAFEDGQGEAELVVEAERLLKAFVASPYRPARVLAVEEPFSLVVDHHPSTGERFDFEERLTGVFDLVVEDDNGTVAVVDHKICTRRPIEVPGPNLQMVIYGIAAAEMFGADEPVRLHHQRIVRNKTPVVEMHEIRRSEQDEAEAVEAVVAGVELINVAVGRANSRRLLGRRRSWRCHGCGYRSRCSTDRA